jgi:cobalt-zinc-cadmium efflux system protein
MAHRQRHEQRGGENRGEEHGGGPRGSAGARRLGISLGLTLSFMLVEAVGGWLTNSLALLSDAGHMLTDAAALGLSLFALQMGRRPPSRTKTYGYRRFEILAALVNGLTLWAIVALIAREALARLAAPAPVASGGMMAVAGVGLLVNLVSLALLRGPKEGNLNVRGAFLHLVADSLGSVAALAAGVVIYTTGWYPADPLASLGICALILYSSWGLVREAVHILAEGVPAHLDYGEIEQALLERDGVCCVYDLHIWSISGGHDALSAHLVVPDGYGSRRELLREVLDQLRARFGIEHATLQIEEAHDVRDERPIDGRGACKMPGEGTACRIPAG